MGTNFCVVYLSPQTNISPLGFVQMVSPATFNLTTMIITVSKVALEYARKCDSANAAFDEARAYTAAQKAVKAAGIDCYKDAAEALGKNVAYYAFEYGWGE